MIEIIYGCWIPPPHPLTVVNKEIEEKKLIDLCWTYDFYFFPFQGMLIKGGVTLITRGFGQTVTLEPYLFAEVFTKYLCIYTACNIFLMTGPRLPRPPVWGHGVSLVLPPAGGAVGGGHRGGQPRCSPLRGRGLHPQWQASWRGWGLLRQRPKLVNYCKRLFMT